MAKSLPRSLSRLLACVLGMILLLLGAAYYAETTLSRRLMGGIADSFSTRLYSAPFLIDEKYAETPDTLIQRLSLLGYKVSRSSSPRRGFYNAESGSNILVNLRGFAGPFQRQNPGLYSLSRSWGSWKFRNARGDSVGFLWLEPQQVAELSGPRKIRRSPASSAEIPANLKKAVVAAEDKRFYTHWGIDWRAILRALRNDLSSRGPLAGGSTITQQLAKNIFLTPARTLWRKAAEAFLAAYMEATRGKDAILTIYLNTIYLGQDGPVSVSGAKEAARFYFGERLPELTLAQCAALAGLIRSPYRYNPFRDPRAALKRRNFVLSLMRENGFISPEEMIRAQREPLGLRTPPGAGHEWEHLDYFTAETVRRLLGRYPDQTLFAGGLSIYTTMDPLLQKYARQAIVLAWPQGALAALDPQTGAVLALMGGRSYAQSEFNRATQAQRQPGSAFKPFLYGAALEQGFTAASWLDDSPKAYPRDLKAQDLPWVPRNYKDVYHGRISLRNALALSLNAASLDLAQKVGVSPVIAFAERMGIKSPIEPNLASMLGASVVTPLELFAAYSPFVNGGFRVEPYLVAAVLDASGQTVERREPKRTRVLEEANAYLMTSLLKSVVSDGTARKLKDLGLKIPLAGKTGTSNRGRDAWFVGYSPRLLAGVWVGDDRSRPLGITGASAAIPVWSYFMKKALPDYPSSEFPEPSSGLVTETIDPASGLEARWGCPQRIDEVFLRGTEPHDLCPLHPGGIFGWLKRVFGGTGEEKPPEP